MYQCPGPEVHDKSLLPSSANWTSNAFQLRGLRRQFFACGVEVGGGEPKDLLLYLASYATNPGDTALDLWCRFPGARRGTWTPTTLRPADFKSHLYYHNLLKLNDF